MWYSPRHSSDKHLAFSITARFFLSKKRLTKVANLSIDRLSNIFVCVNIIVDVLF